MAQTLAELKAKRDCYMHSIRLYREMLEQASTCRQSQQARSGIEKSLQAAQGDLEGIEDRICELEKRNSFNLRQTFRRKAHQNLYILVQNSNAVKPGITMLNLTTHQLWQNTVRVSYPSKITYRELNEITGGRADEFNIVAEDI